MSFKKGDIIMSSPTGTPTLAYPNARLKDGKWLETGKTFRVEAVNRARNGCTNWELILSDETGDIHGIYTYYLDTFTLVSSAAEQAAIKKALTPPSPWKRVSKQYLGGGY